MMTEYPNLDLVDIKRLKKEANSRGLSKVSARIIDHLWVNFSYIQKATYLILTDESIDRFFAWIETGNDDDAWG